MSPTSPDGFLALPTVPTGRAVLVLHAWWGLNDTFRTICTQLAEAGFTAFAPDLYHGKVTSDPDEAEHLVRQLFDNLPQMRTDVAAAVAYLREQAGADEASGTGIAVIGYSMGAFCALDASVSDPEGIRAVVLFYGTGPGDFSKATAAYLGHFAEEDAFETADDVEHLRSTLAAAGRAVTFHEYPGTGHWFCEPDRPGAYHAEAARLAWERTLAFLNAPGA